MAEIAPWLAALTSRIRKGESRQLPSRRYPMPAELTYPAQPAQPYVSNYDIVSEAAESLGNQPRTQMQRDMQGWWLYRNSLEQQAIAEREELMRNPVSAFRLRTEARMGRLRDLTLGRQAAELAALYQTLGARRPRQ